MVCNCNLQRKPGFIHITVRRFVGAPTGNLLVPKPEEEEKAEEETEAKAQEGDDGGDEANKGGEVTAAEAKEDDKKKKEEEQEEEEEAPRPPLCMATAAMFSNRTAKEEPWLCDYFEELGTLEIAHTTKLEEFRELCVAKFFTEKAATESTAAAAKSGEDDEDSEEEDLYCGMTTTAAQLRCWNENRLLQGGGKTLKKLGVGNKRAITIQVRSSSSVLPSLDLTRWARACVDCTSSRGRCG